jgi:hypothetical protein
MSPHIAKLLSNDSKNVLEQAEHHARLLNHEYVGTEHVLLALAHADNDAAHVLQSMGITADRMRDEIAALVLPGPLPVTKETIPLTPRANAALQYAIGHAQSVGQPFADPGHLLLGLLHEPAGVASVVLRKLGLDLRSLEVEVLRIRIAQMKIVERVVRPLHTSVSHKRKLREELLAHLTAIYTEEQQSLKNPAAALESAAKRFGNPEDLAREFDRDVPILHRIAYTAERWLGWRSHESAARYSLRIALYVAAFNTMSGILLLALIADKAGWTRATVLATLPIITMLYIVALDVFALGLIYYKTRDSLHGAFGVPRSRTRVAALQLAFASIVLASFLLMFPVNHGPVTMTNILGGLVGAAWAVFLNVGLARANGPMEIQDTVWACLDLEAA